MTSSLTLSVVIPVYNNQSGVEQCLESISNNKGICFSEIEVIIVDNNSSNEIRIERTFPFNVKLTFCSARGSYAARNAGVKVASGDVIAFLDSDCLVAEDWIQNGVKIVKYDGRFIYGGDVRFIKSEKPSVAECYQLLSGFGQKDNIEFHGFSATANIFVTKKTFYEVGFFCEDLMSCGDREWAWRAASKKIISIYCENIVVYTTARSNLKDSIIQARRVTGGRYQLKKIIKNKRENKKKVINRLKTIIYSDYGFFKKIQIFIFALFLNLVCKIEKIRLYSGGLGERR